MEGGEQGFRHSFLWNRTPHLFSLRQRTEHFGHSAPSGLGRILRRYNLLYGRGEVSDKMHDMRAIDLEVALGSVEAIYSSRAHSWKFNTR